MNMQVCVSCSVLDTLQGCQTSLYFLYKLIFFSLLQNLGNQCFLKEFIKKVSPNLKPMMNQNFHVLNKQAFSKKIDFIFFF